MKKTIRIVTLVMCLIMVLSVAFSVYAMTPYSTYTYSQDGFEAASPDAYTPDVTLYSSDMALETDMESPRDLFVDSANDNNVYIADTKNNRIVVMNQYLKTMFTISDFINSQGVPDSFLEPQGVFVRSFTSTDNNGIQTKQTIIYVCDTNNARIVTFDYDYLKEFNSGIQSSKPKPLAVYEAPQSDVFPEGSVYKPCAIAVDDVGRMYVVSTTTYMGVITLSKNGSFVGFIGAQEVNLSVYDRAWRQFQTQEQRENSAQYVSTEFNNITIDDGNFLYVTSNSIKKSAQQASTKNATSSNAPVKMLNAKGIDVLKRNGFYGPGGEVVVDNTDTSSDSSSDKTEDTAAADTSSTVEDSLSESDRGGASSIVDAAVGPYGCWSIIDETRSKIYTYDSNGELLYIFGDMGLQEGNTARICSIEYMVTEDNTYILVLDRDEATVTRYKRTEYGDLLSNALENRQLRQYDKTYDYWMKIMQRNSNFDAAYIGIGNSLKNKGEYKESLEYYEYAYDTANWSESYKNIRENWIYKFPLAIPLIVVAFVVLLYLIFRYAHKVNVAGQIKTERRSYWEEILYGFWVIFHPFDGFWDLKHEQRGSIRGSIIWIILTIISFQYKSMSSGYLVKPEGGSANIVSTILTVILPIFLWCIANWCLTTLFDGEGTFRDIFIATSYALVPIVLFMIPVTIASHFVIESEIEVLTFLYSLSYIWTGFLVFFGSMLTHDYSFAKNILVCLGTVLGIAFILFLVLLFVSLINKIIGFIYSIFAEVYNRIV